MVFYLEIKFISGMPHIYLEFFQQSIPSIFVFLLNPFDDNGFPGGAAELSQFGVETKLA